MPGVGSQAPSTEGLARRPLRSPGDPRPAGAAQTMNSWRRLPARLASVEEAGSAGARAGSAARAGDREGAPGGRGGDAAPRARASSARRPRLRRPGATRRGAEERRQGPGPGESGLGAAGLPGAGPRRLFLPPAARPPPPRFAIPAKSGPHPLIGHAGLGPAQRERREPLSGAPRPGSPAGGGAEPGKGPGG